MLNSIDELIGMRDNKKLSEVLRTFSSFEVADLLVNKSEEKQLQIFIALPVDLAFEAFDLLSSKTQRYLLQSLPSAQAAYLLKSLSPDDRTAFLEDLPRETIDAFVKLLPAHERLLTLKLLGYPEESIGRLMTTDYIAVMRNWTVEKVLDHIKAYGHDSETIDYIYVIDEEGILLGIVTIDDILRLSDEEATEDIQKIGGMEALDEPYMQVSFPELIKKRAGWLVILFLGEMMTATALGYFEGEIAKAVVLALFLPLVISSGGNAGSQAATLIVRALALEEVKLRDWWKVVKREFAAGLVLGLILGLIGFLRVVLWSQFSNIYGEHWFLLGLTIYFSLMGVVLWGTLAGSLLPLILRYFRIDPATSSAPFIATMVDVVGLIIYFCVAILILKGTLL